MRVFSREIAAQFVQHTRGNQTLAVYRLNHLGFATLEAENINVVQSEDVMEHTCKIKAL
ncbi:MAG: hypothetical protein HRT36_07350 [Alphaproteobacteria bacterium]|nr:hypothetical protein [Alphaproteobacteria bacterium]